MKKVIGLIPTACLLLAAAAVGGQTSQLFKSGPITIKTVEPFAYFCVSFQGPYDKIQEVVNRLMNAAREQNVFPAGPLMAFFLSNPAHVEPENLQWDVGFPVTAQALVQSPLEKKQWIFTTVAACVHLGPYEMTRETILTMTDWMKANGYEQNGPILETYVETENRSTAMNPPTIRPQDQKVEIWIPCKKK